MTRPIKFRVLVSNQEIVRSLSFQYIYHWEYINLDILFSMSIGEMFVNHNIKKDSLGQFTGLKDSKGVEIFEGDIVKTDNDFMGKIEYGEGMWLIVLEKKEQADFLYEYLSAIEVIGNIYLNKELLTNTKQ